MTLNLFAEVSCDTEGCDEISESYEDVEDIYDARDIAESDGWLIQEVTRPAMPPKFKASCPTHAPEQEPEQEDE